MASLYDLYEFRKLDTLAHTYLQASLYDLYKFRKLDALAHTYLWHHCMICMSFAN